MSYILDALRRADAERERGAVPGLHAQPVPPVSADAAGSGGPGRCRGSWSDYRSGCSDRWPGSWPRAATRRPTAQ